MVVAVLVLAALVGYGAYLRHSADDLRDDLASLTVGRSPYADMQRLKDKYHRFVVIHWGAWDKPTFLYNGPTFAFTDAEPCTPSRCAVVFRIDNSVLARLRLVNPAFLIAQVAVLDNKVVDVELGLYGGVRLPTFGRIEYTDCCPSFHRDRPYDFPTPVGKPYLFVSFSSSATATQKEHAFDLRMRCLVAKTNNCDHPCEYLPKAWRDYAAAKFTTADVDYFRKKGINCD